MRSWLRPCAWPGRSAALLLALWAGAACYEWVPAPDGGSPDGDSDSDGDGDTDADSDWPPDDCGHVNQLCCSGERNCIDGATCVNTPEGTTLCFQDCEIDECDYPGRQGFCQDLGDRAICIADGMLSTYCVEQTEDCVTEYGVRQGTVCLRDGPNGYFYCLEECEAIPSGCSDGYRCSPLTDGSGAVCVPVGG